MGEGKEYIPSPFIQHLFRIPRSSESSVGTTPVPARTDLLKG
jgi:hypothetical protein